MNIDLAQTLSSIGLWKMTPRKPSICARLAKIQSESNIHKNREKKQDQIYLGLGWCCCEETDGAGGCVGEIKRRRV
jgi:hypothetical protein